MNNNSTDKFIIDCPHCKQRFSVKVPRTHLFNNPYVSIATAPHEKPIRCINCNHYCVIGFSGLKIAWAIAPITDEVALAMEPSKIITPSDLPPLKGLH